MNFDLISADLTRLEKEKTPLLIILLPKTESSAAAPASSGSGTDAKKGNKTKTPAKAPKAASQGKATTQVQPGALPEAGLSALIHHALSEGDALTEDGKVLSLYQAPGLVCKHLLLVGVGTGDAKSVKKAVLAAMRTVKEKNAHSCIIALNLLEPQQQAEAIGVAAQAVAQGSYVYTHTKPSAKGRTLEKVQFAVGHLAACKAPLLRARALVAGIELTKEWANRPANHATPTMLGTAALALAKAHKRMRCQVLEKKQIEKLGMGSFLSVTQGSTEPPQFIVLEYSGAAKSQPPIVLIGKGISFDSGGISLKPAPDMDEMKFDMCGAASVLGVFASLGQLQPDLNVVGLIPTCENLPSGSATKPGDVVTSMSGQTIEILNTDAEGRLILCDALTYARKFKPKAVVDIATLTGACVIALGSIRCGMYANVDELALRLTVAGEQALDPCWRMPLDDEYAEGLKSNFADMANVAGRFGGSITAAKFLQKFAQDLPWAHLDIAGVSHKSGAEKGATGRPVPLLLEFLLTYLQDSNNEA